MVQGCAFVEVGIDLSEVQEAKKRRGAFAEYVAAIQGVTPDDFEAAYRGMLAELGVEDPVVTRHSADEGIDFYGTSVVWPASHVVVAHRTGGASGR